VALVGAPNTTVGGKSGQGVVYVFTETNGTWVQTQVLTAGNGQSGDAFGISVSVASPWAFIGAPNTDNFRGAVYVFRRSGRTWMEGQTLLASDATTFNQFGWSIAQDGRRALIGSINATVGTNSSQGAVYFFKNDSGLWSESQKFSSSDGVSGDSFGWAVALDHDDALVGAGFATVDDHEFQGAAYTFHRDGDLWTETQKLTADNGEAFDFFGLAVALGRNQALVGAEGASTDGNPFSNQGVVYVYSHEDQSWNPLQTLAASDGEPSDRLWPFDLVAGGPSARRRPRCYGERRGLSRRDLHFRPGESPSEGDGEANSKRCGREWSVWLECFTSKSIGLCRRL
jgi:hypothetical protein